MIDIEQILHGRGKYIVYVELSDEMYSKAQENITNLGILYLSNKPSTEAWGDDWNDNPAVHNAGPPYDEHISSKLEMKRDTKIFTRKEVVSIIRDLEKARDKL